MQNLKVLKYVGDEKKAEWGKYWIELGFNGNWCTVIYMHVQYQVNCHTVMPLPLSSALEKILQKTASKYCVGDEVREAIACLSYCQSVTPINKFS